MSGLRLDRDALRVYLRLLAYAKRYVPLFLLALLGMVIYSVTQTAFAALMKPLMNGGFVQRDAEVIRAIAVEIFGLFLVRGLASFTLNYSMSWIGRQVIKQLRGEFFEKLLVLPVGFFDRSATGMLVSKLTYNTEQVAESTTNSIKVIIRDTLTVAGLIGWMVYLNWVLTALVLVVAPVIAWLVRYISQRFRRVSSRIQDSMGDVTRTAEEVITGQRVVKLYGGQAYERARFEKFNEENRIQNMKMALTSAASNPLIQVIGGLGLSVVIYVVTLSPFGSARSVGDFASFLTAVTLLLPPLRRLTDVNANLQRGIAAGHSIFNLLDIASEESGDGHAPNRVQGRVEYTHVVFAYDKRKGDVLRDVSFIAESGDTVALVGRSGSGKTTLAGLLPRFYDVQDGAIRLDSMDVREYPLEDLRRQIALVGQDVVLFNDTISHNIAYGSMSGASPDEIREVARAAQILEDIERLPEGFDTLIGDRGLLLSGGQRQRLAIARALLKDAPVLVLDEATSALDSESEQRLQTALERLMRNRTTLVIAHRLSTVERADRILVLDRGRIVESGTHRELLRADGYYAQFYRLQFRRSA